MKRTPWFPAEVRPVHEGFYEVKRGLHVHNVYPKNSILKFDGYEWRHTEHSSNGLFVDGFAQMSVGDKWRGLAEPPKKAKVK